MLEDFMLNEEDETRKPMLNEEDETRKPLEYVMIKKREKGTKLNLKYNTSEGTTPSIDAQVSVIAPSKNQNNFANLSYLSEMVVSL
jgi:hypothetical protein